MTKPNLLSVAFIFAALLTTPAVAQRQLSSQRLIASARITATTHSADGQTLSRNRPSDLRRLAERDVWGHWGAYYGPMVSAP
jgi:hypothetical protein